MCICILSGIILSNYGLLNQLDMTNRLITDAPLVRAGGEFDDVIPFIYGIYGTPLGFDPLDVYDGTSGDVILNHLEGLYAFDYSDPKMILIPRLAVDMGSWNAAGTEWTIEIRDDVKWHDGSKFTASDVKWNWDRLNTLAASQLSAHSLIWYNNDGDLMLESTEVIDDHTIKFTLTKEWKDFEFLQSFWGCTLIKPVDGKEEAVITNDEYQLIIGTGPFILDDYVIGDKTVLVANNKYYRGPPDIQKLIFKAYGSTTSAMNALMAQECHVVRHVYADSWDVFDANIALSYHLQKMAVSYMYQLNVINIDWAVRKAMQYAYNYDYHINVVMDGTVAEIHTPVPDGMIGHNPDLPGLPYYNLTKARQYLLDDPSYAALLASRGIFDQTATDQQWKDIGTNNPLATHNFTTYGTGFELQIIDNMEYIGIKIVENQVGDWSNFLENNLDSLEMVMGGWGHEYWHPINQIEPIYSTTGSSNWNGLANETIDDMIDDAHLLTGAALETKIDEIVTAVVVEQAAAMYIFQRINAIGWSATYVSNLDDLFNAAGEKYFYNVEFALSDPPELIMMAPSSESSWNAGKSYNISWTCTTDIPYVSIDLYKDDLFIHQIAANISNIEEYSWKVSSNLKDSTQYQVKVYDTSDENISSISDYFEIVESLLGSISSFPVGVFGIIGIISIIGLILKQKK
jgi:ABC-type transport system substrate-binding protein